MILRTPENSEKYNSENAKASHNSRRSGSLAVLRRDRPLQACAHCAMPAASPPGVVPARAAGRGRHLRQRGARSPPPPAPLRRQLRHRRGSQRRRGGRHRRLEIGALGASAKWVARSARGGCVAVPKRLKMCHSL